MYNEFGAVLVFMLLGIGVVVGGLVTGWFIRPYKPNPDKSAIYECGEPTVGSAWIRYNSRFYTVALVYLLFDVEVVVLLPAALVLKELAGVGYGWSALVGLLVFLVILAIGLAYEWYYGNLDWIRGGDGSDARAEGEGPLDGR
jgi:NADH-quinone oxidoreductase subunit A